MKIEAKIIAHSECSITGKEIITWELTYPRFIHSEFMTHRLFSRNAASSRAIPVAKMLEMVREHPAMPVRFGANQAGMQDKGVDHDGLVYCKGLVHPELVGMPGCPTSLEEAIAKAHVPADEAWFLAAHNTAEFAGAFANAGYHKQVANRLIEPFQWMKTVMTATEDDNWFWLRDHNDADPTIHTLASVMWEAKQASEPVVLTPNDWHMPYFGDGYWLSGCGIPLEDALAISSSCCAQVSYRKLDDSLEKAKDIFAKLIESKPCHASPTEHQAKPMSRVQWGTNICGFPFTWDAGVTHADRGGNLWSGNFKSWIQHRQLIPDNVCNNYVPGTKETTND